MDLQEKPAVITATPNGFRVTIKGGIHTNVAWLDGELKRVAAAKPGKVDLDLAEVPFLSSMGIGLLTAFRRDVAAGGGSLQIVALQKQVYVTFRFAYLLDLFQITPAAVVATANP